MDRLWKAALCIVFVCSGCSPGSGEMQWTKLNSAAGTPDAPTAPDNSNPAPPADPGNANPASGFASFQQSGGAGRVIGNGLSAHLTIAPVSTMSVQGGLSVRNLHVSWGR